MAGVTSKTSSAAARAVDLHAVATVFESENRKDGEVAELMAVTAEPTVRSGASWCGGDGEGDLRWCSVKTRSKEAVQSV